MRKVCQPNGTARERTCALPVTIHKQFELLLPELTLTKKLFGMARDDSIPADSQSSGVAVTEHNTHDPRLGTSSSLRRFPSHQIAWIRRDLPALPYTVPVFCLFSQQLVLSRVSIIDGLSVAIEIKLRPNRLARARVCVLCQTGCREKRRRRWFSC